MSLPVFWFVRHRRASGPASSSWRGSTSASGCCTGSSAAPTSSGGSPSTRSGRSGTATRCGSSSAAPPSSPRSPAGTRPGSPPRYLALVLLLLALMARGVSFEFRGRRRRRRWRGSWSWALAVGSLLAPLLLGVALGDLLAGLPVDSQQEFTGTFWDLLTPYGVFVGVTMVVLCVVHGATFLALKTDGPVRERAHRVAGGTHWVGRAARCSGSRSGHRSLADAGIVRGWLPGDRRARRRACVSGALDRTGREGWAFTATAVADRPDRASRSSPTCTRTSWCRAPATPTT